MLANAFVPMQGLEYTQMALLNQNRKMGRKYRKVAL